MFGTKKHQVSKWDQVEEALRRNPSEIFHTFNIHRPSMDLPDRFEYGSARLRLLEHDVASFDRICIQKADRVLVLGAFSFSDEIVNRSLEPIVMSGLSSHFHLGVFTTGLRFLPFPERGGIEDIKRITSLITKLCYEDGDVIELKALNSSR